MVSTHHVVGDYIPSSFLEPPDLTIHDLDCAGMDDNHPTPRVRVNRVKSNLATSK